MQSRLGWRYYRYNARGGLISLHTGEESATQYSIRQGYDAQYVVRRDGKVIGIQPDVMSAMREAEHDFSLRATQEQHDGTAENVLGAILHDRSGNSPHPG